MVAEGPQAARRPPDRRPEGRAAGRRPDRRRPEPAEADDHARPRHLLLLERGARPLDRHGGRRRRPRPRGRDAAHPDAGPAPSPPRSSRARSSTTPRTPGSAPEMESSMNAMTATLRRRRDDHRAAADDPDRAPPRRPAPPPASGCPTAIGTAQRRGRAHRPLPRPRRMADRGARGRRAPRCLAALADLATRQPLSAVEVSDREITYAPRRPGRPRPARHRLPARPRADAGRLRRPHRLRHRPGRARPARPRTAST